MLSRLVVYCELNLVGLVDINVVILGLPSVIPCCSGSCHDLVLDLDSNKGIWGTTKTSCGSMIDVFDRDDSNRELTGQWLP